MRRKRKPVQAMHKTPHPLTGVWFNGDEYETNVEYTIAESDGHFSVRAVDRFDGEEGDVRDVKGEEDGAHLSFTVYWNSTGRLLKARVLAISPNRISYTYTFTENQMWFRKGNPNADVVVVPRNKVEDYLLDLKHALGGGMAKFFIRFGFRRERWQELAGALQGHIQDNPVAQMQKGADGLTYVAEGRIKTPSGRKPRVRTIWLVELGELVPRFITAYPWEA